MVGWWVKVRLAALLLKPGHRRYLHFSRLISSALVCVQRNWVLPPSVVQSHLPADRSNVGVDNDDDDDADADADDDREASRCRLGTAGLEKNNLVLMSAWIRTFLPWLYDARTNVTKPISQQNRSWILPTETKLVVSHEFCCRLSIRTFLRVKRLDILLP